MQAVLDPSNTAVMCTIERDPMLRRLYAYRCLECSETVVLCNILRTAAARKGYERQLDFDDRRWLIATISNQHETQKNEKLTDQVTTLS